MIRYIYEQNNSEDPQLNNITQLAKSDSGCSGADLRKVHYQIGLRIGNAIRNNIDVSDVVLMPLLTGAIPFAFGVGEVIDVKMLMIDPHSRNKLPDISENTIIILDEVINTGKTMQKIADYYKASHKVILATTVMPEDSEAFEMGYDIYTYRTSKHRYTGDLVKSFDGTKGPDTAARLYSLIR